MTSPARRAKGRRRVIAALVGWMLAACRGRYRPSNHTSRSHRPPPPNSPVSSTDPAFERATGIQVRVVALGTGQALALAERGDADAVLTHDPAAEAKEVAAGWLIERREVMYNDFVLLGPAADPAYIRRAGRDRRLSSDSRRPGTDGVARGPERHPCGRTPVLGRRRMGRRTPRGIAGIGRPARDGPALNTAAALDAYLLADRGTWLSFANRGSLTVLLEGDARMFNQYAVALVNPARHPSVKAALARRFADWLVSDVYQAAIGAYTIAGQRLFVPNAAR
ncbi:MAG: substrate-binding domain-containing protein [Gemmatimonadales bacterium]